MREQFTGELQNAAAGAARRGRPGAADRLRQRRESDADAIQRPAARNGHPDFARRNAWPDRLRQLLVESMILGVAGGSIGLLVAVWAKDVLLAMLPEGMSVAKSIASRSMGMSWRSLIALRSPLHCCLDLLPALRASRPDLGDTLKEGGRAVSASLGRNRMRAVLVAGEMAIAHHVAHRRGAADPELLSACSA